MSEADAVIVERDGPVTIVSINRPHCRNAVDGATARKLFDAFRAFDADAEASVAVFTDEPSAAVLSGLPGLELDPAAVRRVLDDPDPVAAGIAAAAGEARALLAIPGVAGVNISGAASARGCEFAAQVKAELAVLIREERDRDP